MFTLKRIAVATSVGIAAFAITAQTFASDLVDVVNSTASGAVNTAVEVSAGPAGTIVYTIMGIGLLVTVIGLLYSLKGRHS